MKKTFFKKISYQLILPMLIAVIALGLTSCKNSEAEGSSSGHQSSVSEAVTVGQGNLSFSFSAFDKNGNESKFIVKTNKTTVGEALVDAGLISGDDGQYGLYVKTVNGITLDWDTDKMYWSFFVNGEYAMSGVDTTNIEAGASYSFKPMK